MKHCLVLSWLGFIAHAAFAFYTMAIFAPNHPEIDAQMVNARDRAFIIGVEWPTTYCDPDQQTRCPAGTKTLVNSDMTLLAASVPGGQFIYISPDGSVSYPSAHSSLRPPGSQMGGFYSEQIASDCDMPVTILTWRPSNSTAGLWACQTAPGVPFSSQAQLKATTRRFRGADCLAVEGILITYGGDDFGAWAYT